tara:strand:+ start:1116 stop:2354 length:1239 start_codon:yes stop_codon:yes gene_type:complete
MYENQGYQYSRSNQNSTQNLNLFTPPGHHIETDLVHSVQLNRSGNPSSAPILQLNQSQQLHLSFEILEFDSRQFRITFSHHNPDWSRSSLPPEFFINGMDTHILDAGQVSRVHRPSYRQYSYQFPNNRFQFTKSGNYQLQIRDHDNGDLILQLPFFVTENEGDTRSTVETFPVPRQNMRITHRPVSWYSLPDIVDQPFFDLEFYFTQNQFWGKLREADEVDFSDPDEVKFELSNQNSFVGDYEFLTLSLNNLTQSNPQIVESRPGEYPPTIYLTDDVSGFSSSRSIQTGRYGRPNRDLTAQYANVVFTFDPAEEISYGQSIYLVGDFNNWMINPDTELKRDENLNRWQTSSIIKEGSYSYKYVLMANNQVDELYFDDQFSRTRQEYHSFVYMRDSSEFYYRLLHVNRFLSDS